MKRKSKVRIWIAGFILTLSMVHAQPPAPAAAQKKPVDIAAQKAKAWEAFPRSGSWMQRHEGFLARARQGKVDVLFLGDSITDGWNRQKELWEKYYAPLNAANFGIGGDRTENIVWRLKNGELNRFLTPDGVIPKSLMPDFLHLSVEGYQIWAESIQPALSEMLK